MKQFQSTIGGETLEIGALDDGEGAYFQVSEKSVVDPFRQWTAWVAPADLIRIAEYCLKIARKS